MTKRDLGADAPNPIAISPAAGPMPAICLGESIDLWRLLRRTILWTLRRAGTARAQEEGKK